MNKGSIVHLTHLACLTLAAALVAPVAAARDGTAHPFSAQSSGATKKKGSASKDSKCPPPSKDRHWRCGVSK